MTSTVLRFLLVTLLAVGIGYACARSATTPAPVTPPAPPVPPPPPAPPTEPPAPEPADAGVATVEPDHGWTMLAVGDIQLGRTIYADMVELDDYTFPMRAVADRLSAADLTVGNLEAQIFDRCKVLRVGMRLCAGPRAMESIELGGFDVLSVANNHSTNFGKRNLR